MNNGCICCTVRGDLIRIVGGLMKRRGKFDGIIIETTGLANPAPVAQTFFVDDGVRAKTRLDAIVTVVDAKNLPAPPGRQRRGRGPGRLRRRDRAEQGRPRHARRSWTPSRPASARINRYARIHRATRSNVAISDVLGQGAFDLARVLEREPDFLESDEPQPRHRREQHELRGRAARSTPRSSTPGWARCCRSRAADMLRTKGILSYPGEDRRFAFQAVHMIADGDFVGPWPAGQPRRVKAGVHRPQPEPPATPPRLRGLPGAGRRRYRDGRRVSETLRRLRPGGTRADRGPRRLCRGRRVRPRRHRRLRPG